MNKAHNELRGMVEQIAWLRGMTSSELIANFPRNFSPVIFDKNNPDVATMGFLARDARLWKMTGEHMKFLSRNLKINFFIACDAKGKEVPKPTDNVAINLIDKFIERYEQAERQILFEGFYVKDGDLLDAYGFRIAYLIDNEWKWDFNKIEDLANRNTPYFLTERGMKDIDIWKG